MILVLFASLMAHAQSDAQLGQYFHARAEAELVHYLEARDISMQTAVAQDEKLTCANLDEFAPTLEEVKQKAREALNDYKQDGALWRTPAVYGDTRKQVVEPKHMMGYMAERMRFTRLEAFSRLANLSLGCLDVFRTDPSVARNVQEVPRFRLESIANVTPPLFCTVAVRYWKEVYAKMPVGCKKSED